MKKNTKLTVQSPPPPLGGDITAETVVVGLYLRVSTDRQANEGDSLEEQESELRKYCDYRNFRTRVQVLSATPGVFDPRKKHTKLK